MEPFSVIGRNDKTEKGYTYAMRKNILGAEAEIREKNDEELLYFDRKGNLKGKIQGKGFEVNIAETEILKDKIVTHNHPRALGKSGIKAIGNSFSPTDIVLAVHSNVAEIRAVTPTYTFSLKRPKGGWGASVEEVKKWVQFYNNQILCYEYDKIAKSGGCTLSQSKQIGCQSFWLELYKEK